VVLWLTILWVLLVAVLTWLWISRVADGIEFMTTPSPKRKLEVARATAEAFIPLTLALVGGPVVLAVLAFTGRLARRGWTFLGVAAVFVVFLAVPGAQAYRTLYPLPPPPPPATQHCVIYSGGLNTWPGG
jgi:hypothetical protein